MAMMHLQPHLSLQQSCSDPEDDNDDRSSSSGELLRGGGSGGGGTASSDARSSSSSSLRRRSYSDAAILPDPDGGAPAPLPRSSSSSSNNSKPPPTTTNNIHVWTTDEHAAEAYLLVSATPGYVSFEDVIGGAALYRDGSGRPLEAAISDPLLRTTSRLYDRRREGGRSHGPRRQPSPGPLGTRRGSAMHAIVKKYVHPLQGFLAGIFVCCIIPPCP